MDVLGEYHAAVGRTVNRHGATLVSLAGDGVMILVNAPVACPEPALRAARMVIEMQATVQALAATWRARGHALGFGVGLAMGPATVGRIGSDSRMDYTAIGTVTNPHRASAPRLGRARSWLTARRPRRSGAASRSCRSGRGA